MPAAINAAASGQEAYRAQLAQNRADKQMASLSRSLESSANIAKVVGADTAPVQSALNRVATGTQTAASPQASTKVSLSSEGVSKQQSELKANQAALGATAGT